MVRNRKNVQEPRVAVLSAGSVKDFSDSEAETESNAPNSIATPVAGQTIESAYLKTNMPRTVTAGAASPQSASSPSKKTAVKRKRRKNAGASQVEVLMTGILKYAFDVLVKIFSLLKWPLALFLTIYLARFLLFRSISRITGAVHAQVRQSVCSMPFASTLVSSSFLPDNYCVPAKPIDFADMMALQQQGANGIISSSSSSAHVYTGNLPLQLKRAELATSDLRTLLQQSGLSCKSTLDAALSSFSTHARDSSRAIQKTVVRVRGMVDAQLAMNEWAITALSRIESKSHSLSAALVPAFIGSYDDRASVTRTYIVAMDELSDYVRRLIEANEAAYESLDYLEQDLHLIHEITGLEKQFQKTSQDEVLSTLWSFLGGNKKAKKVFRENLQVLGDFERSRIADKEVVAATSVAFQKMMLQIEYMREQIQRPGLSRDDIPIEVHIRNIELGIENLQNSKTKGTGALDDNLLGLLDG